MKKFAKTIALLLALVLCLSVTVLAANVENELGAIVNVAEGAVVEFATDGAGEEQINVTYTNSAIEEGGFYLVMVLKNDGSEVIDPTEENILDMKQATGGANHTVSFSVYASRTEGTVEDCVIMFYGLDSAVRLATIESKSKGDVDGDGAVTASDAAEILRAVAGLSSLTGSQESAGDVDGDGAVTASDAAYILRVVAGLDSLD